MVYVEYESNKNSQLGLKIIVFLSICIVYAFSNIRELSIAIQFVFVFLTVLNVILNKKIKLTTHFIWMLLFLSWAAFVSLFSKYEVTSIIEISNLTLKLLFYTSLIIFIDNEEKFEFVLKSLVISGLILVLRVISLTPKGDWGTDRLGSALSLNPNYLGISLSFTSIVAIYLGFKLKKKIYFLFLIPFIIVGLLTGSKKALLAILAGIFLLVYFRTKNILKKGIILILVIVGIWFTYIAMMNIPILYEVLGFRVEEAINLFSGTNTDKSTLHRLLMAKEAQDIFKENPIFGIGLENFRNYSVFGTYSHNNYMEVLVSTGLPGFVIYYSLPLYLLFHSIRYKNYNTDYSLIISTIIIILLLDFANVSYRQIITQVMIALCVSKIILLKSNINLNYEVK